MAMVADQRLPLARHLNRALVDRLYSPPTAEGGPLPTGGDHPALSALPATAREP